MSSWRSHISLSSIALFVFVLVTLFLFHAMSGIMELKFMELKQAMERERIMNLELSSRALRNRNRIRLESGGLQRELNRNMLESRVLNSESEEQIEHRLPLTALIVTNGVRLLTFKEPLHLEADREKLMALKLAFYFERSRKYDQALRIYKKLNPEDFPPPFPAFLELHMGFCYLAMGQWDEAREDLERVVANYPATHYERAARFLLEMLERMQEVEKSGSDDPLQMADAMFAAGNCPATVKALNRARETSPLSQFYRYRLALCLEETGDITRATEIFNSLAGSAGPYAREANRRLLMIGHFYGGGPELSIEAENRAVALGDEEMVQEVRETARVTRKPHVVEEIREWKKDQPEKETIMHDVLSDSSPELQRDLKALNLQLSENQANTETNGARDNPVVQREDPDPGEATETEDSNGAEDSADPEMESRRSRLLSLMNIASKEDSEHYEISRPSIHRWPAKLVGDEEIKFLILTQRIRGDFESTEGNTYDLKGRTILAHPSGRLLLRLRDGRTFSVQRAEVQNRSLKTDQITISLDLVYQIAAY